MKKRILSGFCAAFGFCVTLAAASLFSASAGATEVNVVGLFPGKAIVTINGGAPRTLSVGQKTPEGVVLVSSTGDGAVLDIDGKRRSLRLGDAYTALPDAGGGAKSEIMLTADSGGHYHGIGAINGKTVQFMVDTGASTVWMSSGLADRIGVRWRNGSPFVAQTAGGAKQAYRITLDTVRISGLTLNGVEAAVGEGAGTGDTVLLGMTFMSRLNMFRDGSRLVLSSKDAGSAQGANDSRPHVTLQGNGRGFATMVGINGTEMPFIVDTGATVVSIDVGMARRLGLDLSKSPMGQSQTANGPVRTWRVKFDRVTVGPITLFGVDGSVREGGEMGIGLLGMSFLNRIEMRRDGDSMTLIKRF
ncbi:MAG TPA: TIGR02281 family clan AA aspartic protease [Burkholderiales bacterium]